MCIRDSGNGESFWINQKVGPTFYSRRYTRTAINQGTAAESAVECDAPITEAPTTAAPTTAAPTTAAPTTAAPTTYTVNIWGRKSGPATVLLYYGVNDTSCPDGGTTLSTTGALKHTIQVAYGGVVYVRCTNSTDDAVAFDREITITSVSAPAVDIANDANIVATVVATKSGASGGTITFQWQKSTDNGANFTNISADSTYTNVTTAVLTVTGANVSDKAGEQYRCVVSLEQAQTRTSLPVIATQS